MTDEQGAGVCELEGRYTNYFSVGHNAFEVVLVFGQFYEGNHEPRLHTRIVTGPAYAKKLLEVLDHALHVYEATFGPIPSEPPHE